MKDEFLSSSLCRRHAYCKQLKGDSNPQSRLCQWCVKQVYEQFGPLSGQGEQATLLFASGVAERADA